MRWAVHEDIRPQIVWFVGSTADTVVALGGRARHLTALHDDELKDMSKPDARLHHVEMSVVEHLAGQLEQEGRAPRRQSEDWATNVFYLERYWASEMIDEVDFLAVVEEFSRDAGSGSEDQTGALLGSPVWVFKTRLG
jgi:hypothetical protein